jgi:uncharacterized small protein (DUF1192 family)
MTRTMIERQISLRLAALSRAESDERAAEIQDEISQLKELLTELP